MGLVAQQSCSLKEGHLQVCVIRWVARQLTASYQRLSEDFLHEIVNHAIEYVRGRVHTNGMENFWSLLKRALRGTYVAVDPDHLEAYVDEQVFRFNNRKASDWTRFDRLMRMVVGKRLTYSDLTGGKVR